MDGGGEGFMGSLMVVGERVRMLSLGVAKEREAMRQLGGVSHRLGAV